MKELPDGANVNCETFLNELEGLRIDSGRATTAEVLLKAMADTAQQHANRCAECEAALQNFAATRLALGGLREILPVAGPWFTQRVMRSIAIQEDEIEEKLSGFWTNVRRLAPRLVAFATLLLMLGGTWAFQVQRASKGRSPKVSPTEGIFETGPSTPANDDVIASVHEEQLP